jgi:hypothetical protein
MYSSVPTLERAQLRVSCFEYLFALDGGRGARVRGSTAGQLPGPVRRLQPRMAVQPLKDLRRSLYSQLRARTVAVGTPREPNAARQRAASHKTRAHPKSQIFRSGRGSPGMTCSSVFSSFMSRMPTPWSVWFDNGFLEWAFDRIVWARQSCAACRRFSSLAGAGIKAECRSKDGQRGGPPPTFLWQ